jgi:hypothetical protein
MTAPNKSKRWTDTDDAVVLLFTPREAAAILGRTLRAVYMRRSLKGIGDDHRDRKPRKRLRRQFFQDGQGERSEEMPPSPAPKCRYCQRRATDLGLCHPCRQRVQYWVRVGIVTQEMAERQWLGARRHAPARRGS